MEVKGKITVEEVQHKVREKTRKGLTGNLVKIGGRED